MSRDRAPSGRMRFTCDLCPMTWPCREGDTPPGWRIEPARDLCALCVANEAARPWAVTLPSSVRRLFEDLAAANGTSADEQLVRYLESDLGLVDLVADARSRVSGRRTA